MYVYAETVEKLDVPVPVQRGVNTWAGAGQGRGEGGWGGKKSRYETNSNRAQPETLYGFVFGGGVSCILAPLYIQYVCTCDMPCARMFPVPAGSVRAGG